MKYIIATIFFIITIIPVVSKAQPNSRENSALKPPLRPEDSKIDTSKIHPSTVQTTPTNTLDISQRDGVLFNLGTYTLSILVLIFGMIIVLALMYQYTNIKTDFTSEHAVRIISITLITTGLLFIVSLSAVTYTQNGALTNLNAPAFGLLGTMAGYLLGKSSSKENDLGKGNNAQQQFKNIVDDNNTQIQPAQAAQGAAQQQGGGQGGAR